MTSITDTIAWSPGAGPDPNVLCGQPICLFLDVDGTLLDFAAEPDQAVVEPSLLAMLERLQTLLGGALALISGRALPQLDAMFAPLQLPTAGIHGFERRSADGIVYRPSLDPGTLEPARELLGHTVSERPGLLLEDKGAALALHYRGVPQAAEFAQVSMAVAGLRLLPEFEIVEGEKLVELKPAGRNKATAVQAFMRERPFAGRVPVYLGCDPSDFDGFAAVRSHGGMDISVGDRVSARWYLQDPAAARLWLSQLARSLAGT